MKETKVSANRLRKEGIVSQLSAKIGKSTSIVLTNYKGLTHHQLEAIKKAVKMADAEFIVTKNSLLKLALEQNKLKLDISSFDNPTATLFTYKDTLLPLKELAKKIKELKLPEIKIGIIDKQTLTADQILKLSTLPTRETLLTQLAVCLKSPIISLHRSLNWNIQKLVMTITQIERLKSQT